MCDTKHTWIEATATDHDTKKYCPNEHWHNITWCYYSTSNSNHSPADRYFYEANK